jgi:hypothetical protein
MNYHAMMEDALRSVIRDALTRASEDGLPGDHHFYITFKTDFPGVNIPDSLRARFPEEMTIVLQHQFWGLEVGEDLFGVTLSFSDVQERLVIPYKAVTAFADPSVQFGLQFSTDGDGETAEGDAELTANLPAEKTEPPLTAENQSGEEPADSDNVITLDAFRKK